MTTFLRNPLRYMRAMAHEKPVIFWSLVIGAIGPVGVVVIPPVRKKYFGYVPPEPIPTTYPLPRRPRNPPAGYEDDA
ncbi:uncharacterized protein VTP21DRAFT_787 [Calcarisporiella thermophila]|uniref:uncharacterized protein n=1 Tax=Calcarisporiella thermophila TaxID=911321 RepID=UPI0037435B58